MKIKIVVITLIWSTCVISAQVTERLGSLDYLGKQDLWDYPVKPGQLIQ